MTNQIFYQAYNRFETMFLDFAIRTSMMNVFIFIVCEDINNEQFRFHSQ